jgi:OOP family OmpA-OmpF porin
MKKVIVIALLVLSTISVQSQENNDKKVTPFLDTNKLIIEFSTGQAKGISPYTSKYYDSHKFGTLIFNSINIGARYMMSPKFGTKLDFGFFTLNNNPENISLPFELDVFTVGLQGVVNASRMYDIQKSLGKFNLLLHGGLQMSQLKSYNPNLPKVDNNLGLMFGFSPEFRLSKRASLLSDLTLVKNFKQFYTWDGNLADRSINQTGFSVYTSLGLTFSIGKDKVHCDWDEIK